MLSSARIGLVLVRRLTSCALLHPLLLAFALAAAVPIGALGQGVPDHAVGHIRIVVDCRSAPQTVEVTNTGRLSFEVVEVNRYRRHREDVRFPRRDEVAPGDSIAYAAGPGAHPDDDQTLLERALFSASDVVVVHIVAGSSSSTFGVPCATGTVTDRFLVTPADAVYRRGGTPVEVTFKLRLNEAQVSPGYYIEYYVGPLVASRRTASLSFCRSEGHAPCEGYGAEYLHRVVVPRGIAIRYAFRLWHGGDSGGALRGGERRITSDMTITEGYANAKPVARSAATPRERERRMPNRTFQLTLNGDIPGERSFGLGYHELFGALFCGAHPVYGAPCSGGGTTYIVRPNCCRGGSIGRFPYRFYTAIDGPGGEYDEFERGWGTYDTDETIRASYPVLRNGEQGAPTPRMPNTGAGGSAHDESPYSGSRNR